MTMPIILIGHVFSRERDGHQMVFFLEHGLFIHMANLGALVMHQLVIK